MTREIINFPEIPSEKNIIGFDKTIRNVVIVPETKAEGPGVKIVACGPRALDFRCSKNASKTTDLERSAVSTILHRKKRRRGIISVDDTAHPNS